MAYKRTTWVDGSTPLDAANMNNIETGIAEAKSDIVTLDTKKLNASDLPSAMGESLLNLGVFKLLDNNIVSAAGNDTTATWSQIPSGYAFYDTNGCLVDQPSQYGILVHFNRYNETFQMWRRQSGGPTLWRSGNADGWISTWAEVYDSANKPTIEDIVGLSDALQNSLPAYVESEISTAAANLYSKALAGNVAIIGFSTDQHVSKWPDQQTASNTPGTILGLKALRRMADMFPFNAVVFGGDYTGGSASSINEGVYMVYAPLSGAACPVMGTAGNHDSWQDQQDVTSVQIFKRHAARAKVDYPGFVPLDKISANGYYDDPTVNIRYIILDAEPRSTSVSTNSNATITANLTAMLGGMPEGYKAIIFSHKPLSTSLGSSFKDGVNNAAVLEANKAKIICCINGHGHADASETKNGVLYIQTRAAAPTNYMGEADLSTAGTADETAFDVFVVDQENDKIYAVRYGAGSDRTFTIPVTAAIKNQIPISTDTDGSIYNGTGYKAGCRLNSSGTLKTGETQYALTGFIPCTKSDFAYISADIFASNPGSCAVHGFDANKTFKAYAYANSSAGGIVTESNGSYSFNAARMTSGSSTWNDVAFIRVTGVSGMSSASVITVNQPLT